MVPLLLLRRNSLTVTKLASNFRSTRRHMEGNAQCNDQSLAFVTCPNETVAKQIARGLVENKLAACVNMIPNMKSIYSWEGKIEEDSEVLLKIKTRASAMKGLESYVRKLHPFDEVEIISIKIDGGSATYMKWILDNVPPPAS